MAPEYIEWLSDAADEEYRTVKAENERLRAIIKQAVEERANEREMLQAEIERLREELRVADEDHEHDEKVLRAALYHLMEFGKRLMNSDDMGERGIGCCICEGARIINGEETQRAPRR